jgi:hypothetical protein
MPEEREDCVRIQSAQRKHRGRGSAFSAQEPEKKPESVSIRRHCICAEIPLSHEVLGEVARQELAEIRSLHGEGS